MKKPIAFLLLFLASSSFAFELNFDTINAGVTQPLSNPNYVEGELKTLYVNSSNDTLRFDSARVDLIKSENNLCEIVLIGGAIGDSFSTAFYFSNYGEYGGDFRKN